MKLTLEYNIEESIDKVWAHLMKVATLIYIARPLVEFKAVKPNTFPSTWNEGNYETSMYIFGFLPFGKHHIVIEFPTPVSSSQRLLLDNGYGVIISRWKHTITLTEKGRSITGYKDEVIIQASVLTPAVWLFAWVFYRWRRFQWKKLITK
jgi:hypothetical protein